ncbi:MAG: FAD-binding protein [Calditrichales bacterium]|nr:MAG: FAD-binding protein [Calditrichales bacterium]
MTEKDLIIIGSGPAGLQAAHEAQKAGIDYLVLEKGHIAQSWRDIREDMVMLSPCLPQRDWTSISVDFPIWKMDVKRPFCYAYEFVKYLDEFSSHFDLNIKLNCSVTHIQKIENGFELQTDQDIFRSKTVLVASGFFGNPFIPDIPGMRQNPIVSHSHQFKTAESFRNKRVIVIGSGNSAAETAISLAGYAQVYLLTRNELEFFSRTKNLCDIRGISESFLLELISMDIIRYLPNTQIERVEENVVYITGRQIETNAIICATGYNADLSAFGEMEIPTDKRTKFPVITSSAESSSYSDLFFAGPLAYRKISSMLIHGFSKFVPDTVKEIKNRITNNKS